MMARKKQLTVGQMMAKARWDKATSEDRERQAQVARESTIKRMAKASQDRTKDVVANQRSQQDTLGSMDKRDER